MRSGLTAHFCFSLLRSLSGPSPKPCPHPQRGVSTEACSLPVEGRETTYHPGAGSGRMASGAPKFAGSPVGMWGTLAAAKSTRVLQGSCSPSPKLCTGLASPHQHPPYWGSGITTPSRAPACPARTLQCQTQLTRMQSWGPPDPCLQLGQGSGETGGSFPLARWPEGASSPFSFHSTVGDCQGPGAMGRALGDRCPASPRPPAKAMCEASGGANMCVSVCAIALLLYVECGGGAGHAHANTGWPQAGTLGPVRVLLY